MEQKRRKPTKKSNKASKYVEDFIAKNGYAPTYEQVAKKFKLKSKSTAYHRCRFVRHLMVKINN